MPRRGTSRRIIRIRRGAEPTPDQAHWAFLRAIKRRPCSVPEIIEYLVSEGFPRYSRQQINNMVDRYEPVLEKDDSVTPPTYHYTGRDISKLVRAFGIVYSYFTNEFFEKQITDLASESPAGQLVEEMVRRAGVYTLYTELLSWKYTVLGRNEGERKKIQKEWRDNTTLMPYFSDHFTFMFRTILAQERGIQMGSGFSNYDHILREMHELVKVLKRRYPQEMEPLLNLENNMLENYKRAKQEFRILERARPPRRRIHRS